MRGTTNHGKQRAALSHRYCLSPTCDVAFPPIAIASARRSYGGHFTQSALCASRACHVAALGCDHSRAATGFARSASSIVAFNASRLIWPVMSPIGGLQWVHRAEARLLRLGCIFGDFAHAGIDRQPRLAT